MSEFTKQQIADWRVYERVRKGGKYNMFFPEAQRATRLSREDYLFVLKNYTALKIAAQNKEAA